MKVQPVRGTHDLYSHELEKYRCVADVVRNFANTYDYNENNYPISVARDFYGNQYQFDISY